MGTGHEEVGDEIILLRRRTGLAPTAPLLGPVLRERAALDVASVGHGDHHVLLGDEILAGQLGGLAGDLGLPFVAELVTDLAQLGLHHLEQRGLVLQDVAQSGNFTGEGDQLVEQLLPLDAGESLQPHLEDLLGLLLAEAPAVVAVLKARVLRLLGPGPRHQLLHLRLDLTQLESGELAETLVFVERWGQYVHEAPLGLLRIPGPPDDGDDQVDDVLGDQQALHHVHAPLGVAELEAAPPGDHFPAVADESLQQLLEVERPRLAAIDGQQHDAEGGLQRSQGEEVVEHHPGDGIAL